MFSLISSMKVRQKLLLPVVLQVVLLLVILLIYIRNEGLIGESEKEISHNSQLLADIYQLSDDIHRYVESRGKKENPLNDIERIQTSVKTLESRQLDTVHASMDRVSAGLRNISELFAANEKAGDKIRELARGSISQSDSFINEMSRKLADDDLRATVSTLERMVIAGALINTTSNYQLLLLFQEMERDPAVSAKLNDYLGVLLTNVEKDIQRLSGTPYEQMGLAGKNNNLAIQDLARGFADNHQSIEQAQQDIEDQLASILTALKEHQNASVSSVFSSLASSLLNIVAIIAVLSLITGVFSVLTGRSVVNPLNTLGGHIRRLADSGGDLTFRVNMQRHDEIGELARNINQFLETLQTIFAGVSESGARIADNARQSAEHANAAQRKMQRQQEETGEVATAFNEMDTAIQEVASNASSAANAVQHAHDESQQVVANINSMVDGIQQLGRELEATGQVINELNADSQNIGGILDVIRAIAEQTNLLALNAAIEAAWAGEQGRGFAVVADEVRSLAQRTQASIEEIHEMISRLQSGSQRATDAITQGNERIGLTIQNSEDAGKGVGEIANQVSAIADMNLQIASAVEEQSAVANQINQSIQQINDLALESSEASVQANQAADTQLGESAAMLELIGKFKT